MMLTKRHKGLAGIGCVGVVCHVGCTIGIFETGAARDMKKIVLKLRTALR